MCHSRRATLGALAAFVLVLGPSLDAGPSRFGFSDRVERHMFPEVTTGPAEPAWSPDGDWIAFSMHGDLWKVPAEGGEAVALTRGPWYYFEPAWSPDGSTLAFTVDTGGNLDIGTVPAGGGEVTRRTASDAVDLGPTWSGDGRALYFCSSRGDGFDIVRLDLTTGGVVTAVGGRGGQIQPNVSPDGRSLAYVAPVRSRLGTGGIWTTSLDEDGLAVGEPTLVHHFHTDGEFEVRVPVGQVTVTALRGFEHAPSTTRMMVEPEDVADVELILERIADPPALGWYSGDTHAHDYHQGRFGLSHEALFLQSVAEDLHVSNVLIHMDGTRLMGRWADLTGEPHPLSTSRHVLQFGEEFRGSLGHIGMLGVRDYILPLVGGAPNTPYAQVASDLPYVDGARAQGGIAGFMHPYLRGGARPSSWAGSLIPVDVALGRGDFYDVASLYSDELTSAAMYYRLLNVGFRLPATGGTDNFPDVWRDPPPGTDRTYAKVDGPLSVPAWLEAVKAGRTFATTGPLVFVEVEGRDPGAEVRLSGTADATVRVRVRWQSIVPVERLELVVNGEVRESRTYDVPSDPMDTPTRTWSDDASFTVPMPAGGWIAARALGQPSVLAGDSYAFAHTSPVYVVRDGTPPFVSRTDAQFLLEVVDAIWARVDRSAWRTDADRDAFRAEIDAARAIYTRLARPD